MNVFGVSFATPWVLLLLLLLPVAAWWRWRPNRDVGAFRHPDLKAVKAARPAAAALVLRVPDAIRLLAVAALIVALARPQTADLEVLTGEGVDIVVALDMSGSMNAVDMTSDQLREVLDQNEVPANRFDIARQTIRDFVLDRREDRIGLVIFGSEAYVKFPLTLDYSRIVGILDGLVLDNGTRSRGQTSCDNQCTIPGTGTAIGDALSRSYRRLEDSEAESRIIVLITDGQNEGGKLQPRTVANYIAERPEDEQVRIYTFLVGDNEQTFIPQPTLFGGLEYRPPQRPYATDPELLADIAEATGGKFYESYNPEKFKEDFSDLVKTTFETKSSSKHKDVYSPFALAGALMLLLEIAMRTLVFRKFP